MAKITSPLIWWICQNMLTWLLVLIKHWQKNSFKNVLWVKESLMRALFKPLCVNTCSTVSHDFFLLQHLKIHIRLILSTAFNFVSNYTVGCISWQRNRKENFVNGDQMPKWRLFMDWWAQKQGGKKSKLYSRCNGFSSCDS